jgi:hypothetical protein
VSGALKPERRKLTFATLGEAVADAENLLAKGYERAGNWDLAQCCHHLVAVMTYPMDGFPRFGFPMNVGVWFLRVTVARRWLRKVLTSGVWPTGTPTDRRTVRPPGGNDAEAVALLKRAVERLLTHTGPLHASPLFGMLDQETLVKLHRIHTAHHLSFLVPK